MWAKSIMIPVLKKGDASDLNNYREISLISCFCKLFTSILNQRLYYHCLIIINNVITNAQFGFQSKGGTAEAVFSLSIKNHCLITTEGKKGYIAILETLGKYLIRWNESNFGKNNICNVGIRGKRLSINRVMYEIMKCCVKPAGKLSDFFFQK